MGAAYPGPWRIIVSTSLAEQHRLAAGDLMRHKSGVVMLRCPLCNVQQFAVVSLNGDATSPSLTGDVKCTAGSCKVRRCACVWTVINGATVLRHPG
jgi:hypothetical protein